jgi:hypothetical protein
MSARTTTRKHAGKRRRAVAESIASDDDEIPLRVLRAKKQRTQPSPPRKSQAVESDDDDVPLQEQKALTDAKESEKTAAAAQADFKASLAVIAADRAADAAKEAKTDEKTVVELKARVLTSYLRLGNGHSGDSDCTNEEFVTVRATVVGRSTHVVVLRLAEPLEIKCQVKVEDPERRGGISSYTRTEIVGTDVQIVCWDPRRIGSAERDAIERCDFDEPAPGLTRFAAPGASVGNCIDPDCTPALEKDRANLERPVRVTDIVFSRLLRGLVLDMEIKKCQECDTNDATSFGPYSSTRCKFCFLAAETKRLGHWSPGTPELLIPDNGPVSEVAIQHEPTAGALWRGL